MDETRVAELGRTARRVVREARKPGGLLDKNEFTMGLARRQITEKMGLAEGELDGGKWKKVAKEHVMKYLDEPDEQAEAGPSRSASPKAKRGPKQAEAEDDDKHEFSDPTPVIEAPPATEQLDAGDESDMSSVYDAPPPKRRKKSSPATDKKDEGSSKTNSKKREKKISEEDASPDDAKVAELKRIVVACGVRKQWAKEFADFPTASGQIRHLHSLLSDLGMKGNPTMGKAKSLKEKRELAAELNDVREFEAKRGVAADDGTRASRSSSKRSKRDKSTHRDNGSISDGGGEDEDDSRGEGRTGGKERSALDSVMDFLGDQSD